MRILVFILLCAFSVSAYELKKVDGSMDRAPFAYEGCKGLPSYRVGTVDGKSRWVTTDKGELCLITTVICPMLSIGKGEQSAYSQGYFLCPLTEHEKIDLQVEWGECKPRYPGSHTKLRGSLTYPLVYAGYGDETQEQLWNMEEKRILEANKDKPKEVTSNGLCSAFGTCCDISPAYTVQVPEPKNIMENEVEQKDEMLSFLFSHGVLTEEPNTGDISVELKCAISDRCMAMDDMEIKVLLKYMLTTYMAYEVAKGKLVSSYTSMKACGFHPETTDKACKKSLLKLQKEAEKCKKDYEQAQADLHNRAYTAEVVSFPALMTYEGFLYNATIFDFKNFQMVHFEKVTQCVKGP